MNGPHFGLSLCPPIDLEKVGFVFFEEKISGGSPNKDKMRGN